jgi:autotransporter-associated beta strand protein
VNLSGITLAAPTITFSTAGDLIVNSVLSGAGALVKQGNATLFLSGLNSYTGGTRVDVGTIEVARPASLGTGTLTLAGGSLRVNYVAPTPAVFLQNIVVLADSRIEVVQGRTVLSGSISGDARLAVAGNGTLQAAADSAAFHGMFDVQGALLLLKGTGVVPVRAQDGEADLEGSVGDLEISGNATLDVMEGVMTGRLETRNLTMNGGSLKLEIGGNSAGAAFDGHDQLKVTGTVSLAGTLNLALLTGFVPTVGDRFFLVDNDGSDPISGMFANAVHGGIVTVGGYSFLVSYQGDYATGALVGGNDLVLIAVPSVPEAGSKLFGALGVLMWWGEWRRGSNWRAVRFRNSVFPRRAPNTR